MEFLLFNIDATPLVSLIGNDRQIEAALADTMQTIGAQIQFEWAKTARASLKNASGYIQAIEEGLEYPFDGDPFHVVVVNRHPAAMFLEQGTDPFDMKKMLATGKNVKISKDGNRYMAIPLQHSRKSLDNSGIGNMASQLSATRKNVPTPLDPRKTAWGDRLRRKDVGETGMRSKYFSVGADLQNEINKQRFMNRVEGRNSNKVQYTWKSSPFQGLTRHSDNFGKTSGYMTFRTISDKSDSDAWIHPGITASHIAERTVEALKPMIVPSLAKVIRQAFGNK